MFAKPWMAFPFELPWFVPTDAVQGPRMTMHRFGIYVVIKLLHFRSVRLEFKSKLMYVCIGKYHGSTLPVPFIITI